MEISISALVLSVAMSVAVTLAVDYAVLWVISYGIRNDKEDAAGADENK